MLLKCEALKGWDKVETKTFSSCGREWSEDEGRENKHDYQNVLEENIFVLMFETIEVLLTGNCVNFCCKREK